MKNRTVVMKIFKHKETRRSKVVHYAFNVHHIRLPTFSALKLDLFLFFTFFYDYP